METRQKTGGESGATEKKMRTWHGEMKYEIYGSKEGFVISSNVN